MMPPVRDEHDNRGNYLSQTQNSSHLTNDHHIDQTSQSTLPSSNNNNNGGLSKAELRKVIMNQ